MTASEALRVPYAREYRSACMASHKASRARADLPIGSSRAKVTSANARWRCAAEERDRLAELLPVDVRAVVDAAVAVAVS